MRAVKCFGFLSFLSVLFFIVSCSYQQNFVKGTGTHTRARYAAVLPLVNLTSYPHAGRIVGDLLTTEIYAISDFKLMERTQMLEKLKGEEDDIDQVLEKMVALNVGKRLGVDTVIYGSVTEYRYKRGLDEDPVVGINIRMLDVPRQEILWAGSKSGSGGCFWLCEDSLNRLAQKTCHDLVSLMVQYGDDGDTAAYSPQPIDTSENVPIESTEKFGDSDKDGITDQLDQCPDTPETITVDSDGCPEDSDNDGVYDHLDQCPKTLTGIAVDHRGCPQDSDRDGVSDNLDQCPDTLSGIAVDSNGCSKKNDNDMDGVSNPSDQCPETPKGANVDTRGCWVIKGIKFDSWRWAIKPKFYPFLDEVYIILTNIPNLNIEIEGHSDSSGSPGTNQMLSEKRAKAIKQYLIRKGIDAKRLAAKGFGPLKPITTNDTPEGRATNRRVEIRPLR